MPRVLLALGSNLGDRGAILDAAVAAIGELTATQVLARSTWHATKPVGGPAGQGEFLNGAILIETNSAPAELRRELQQIEQSLGRERTERWAARMLDIDILLYDNQVIDDPDLQIPHPRMSFRPFVLAPATEVAAEMVHPVLGVTVGALWHHLQHARNEMMVCGGLLDDRYQLIEGLLQTFVTAENALVPVRPYHVLGVTQGLKIIRAMMVADSFEISKFQSIGKQSVPATSSPKLQIFLQLPFEALSNRVEKQGASCDQLCFDHLVKKPAVPNPMSRLFTGIPTLTLDPRDDPQRLSTEAAAALEAVWPDLCRPGA
jgi:2-amino-4-hydroxy-6-hydroxymethyldihydropteridine diphosphokinase